MENTVCKHGIEVNCHLCRKEAKISESPSVPGYVASLEKACLDIYMSYHASEVRELAASVKRAWFIGKDIWTKRQKRTAT